MVGVAALAAAIFLFAAPAASATKYFDSSFPSVVGAGCTVNGCPGASALGGLFNGPRDVAVNQPGGPAQAQDGWIYVVDSANNRVQAFDSNKQFQWAIGRNVIKAAPTGGSTDLGNVAEKCTVVQDCQAGSTGALGGEFNVAQGIDVDQATGHFFVRERTSARVQEFAADGSWVRAFGWDVVQPGGTGESTINLNERQTVSLDDGCGGFCGGVIGGTFKIAFDGQETAALNYNATPAQIQAALEGLSNLNPGDVTVTSSNPGGGAQAGGPWTVDFAGAYQALNVATIVGTNLTLTTGSGAVPATVSVTTNVQGGPAPGFETCTVATQCKAGTTGANVGQFGSSGTASTGLAVAPPGAPNAGMVIVADPGNRRVQRFSVPSNPTAAVVANAPFGTTANFVSNQPVHVAADANGVIYASDGVNNVGQLNSYDTTTGAFKARLVGGTGTLLGFGAVTSITVDPSNGHLFVGRTPTTGIMEFDVSDNPVSVTVEDLVGTSGAELNIGNPQNGTIAMAGLALNGATGELFVATQGEGTAGTGSGHRVLVLDDDGIEPPPTVALLPAEDVGCTSVTLRADINPNGPTGFPTSYRFEISKTGLPNDWTPVGSSSQLVGATGDGGDFVSVAQPATGLEANTPLYRFRVRTIRSPGQPSVVSAPQLFATAPCPPVVETGSAQQVSDTSAQIVGNLNPSGLATSYWFEWGDTDYGNTAPVPTGSASGSTARDVAETLADLDPDTHYHFRLCAQNSLAPTPVCGVDKTFTTRQTAAPSGTRAYEMVTSPDKPLRRGGALAPNHEDIGAYTDALPAVSGDSVLWGVFAGVADANSGAGWAADRTYEVRRRRADGWYGEAALNVPMAAGVTAGPLTLIAGLSLDLNTQFWGITTPSVFPTGEGTATHVMGDTGGPLGKGWYPFNETSGVEAEAQVTDDGRQLLAYTATPEDEGFRHLVPLDDTVSPSGLAPAQTSGEALFIARPPTWSAADLVNECTGAWIREQQTVSVDATGGTLTLTFNGQTTAPIAFDASAAAVQAALLNLSNLAPGDVFVTGASGGAWTVAFEGNYAGIDLGQIVANGTALAGGSASATVATVADGDPGTATMVPQRYHNGTDASSVDDFVSSRPCGAGSPTDVRGASIGDRSSARLVGTPSTGMSEDGRRVFFSTPSINDTSGSGASSCTAGTGAATACPPQLFVRQFDVQGDAVVRWLSRAEDALAVDGGGLPRQRPLALGTGVAFEGASRDGSVVYFRTDAPLLENDPNGGLDRLAAASPNSWDLYRYELGTDGNADPGGGDPGDRLTRISGGPAATADPNTNCAAVPTAGAGAHTTCVGSIHPPTHQFTPGQTNDPINGAGSVVRHLSDDGSRVYFVTAGQIVGAQNAPPAGGATSPTGSGTQANATSRNLYLYDATKTGADAYKFVARVPFAVPVTGAGIDACLSSAGRPKGPVHNVNSQRVRPYIAYSAGTNCVRGSSSGDAIVFESTARLTNDDNDDSIDVYLYDASSDELIRLSAGSPDDSPYVCLSTDAANPAPVATCNGDLGMFNSAFGQLGRAEHYGFEGLRGWNVSEDEEGRLRAAYFESRLPLAAGASVGDTMKTYEWRRADGRMSLISPPESEKSAFYTGNSQSGDDVFFWTEQEISGWEVESADGDVYNATVRPDPVPEPTGVPAVCAVVAGACQGVDAGSVAVAPRTTSGGGGDAAAGERRAITLGAVGAKARRRAVRSGVLALRVGVTGAGRVSATARAKIAGRLKRVAGASRSVSRSGSTTIALRLSPQARRVLRSGRRLDVAVKVSMSEARPRALRIVLGGRS